MSLSKNIEINCPKCNAKQNFKLWQAVNVTEDKLLREDVFNQEIFRFTCFNCNSESLIEYPFIYHNSEKKFFVYFDSSGKFENVIETEGYKTRTVDNYLKLLEIIRILEDGIDEEKIKQAKSILLDKFKANSKLKDINEIYYSGNTDNKLEFFIPEINGKISF